MTSTKPEKRPIFVDATNRKANGLSRFFASVEDMARRLVALEQEVAALKRERDLDARLAKIEAKEGNRGG